MFKTGLTFAAGVFATLVAIPIVVVYSKPVRHKVVDGLIWVAKKSISVTPETTEQFLKDILGGDVYSIIQTHGIETPHV